MLFKREKKVKVSDVIEMIEYYENTLTKWDEEQKKKENAFNSHREMYVKSQFACSSKIKELLKEL